MTASLAAVSVAAALVTSAIFGPLVLRRSAPALMRAPRTAVIVVVTGAVAWAVGLVALGLIIAWAAGGAPLLAGSAGEMCQRCLAAASPFATAGPATSVPALVPLILAGAVGAATVGGVWVELYRRRRAGAATRAWLEERASQRVVDGQVVSVVESSQAFAWTLPARWGGIVLSTPAFDVLNERELSAVVAHERAHLLQRHHVVGAIMAGLRHALGWVPTVRAATDALPHYLEIAADAHAQREVGARALASALLALGSPTAYATYLPTGAHAPVLHLNGPHRIGALTGLVQVRGGRLSASLVAAAAVAYIALAIAVIAPYGAALASGCVI